MVVPLLDHAYSLRPLTLSGNEITDAVRRAGIEGDGASPFDQSLGVHGETENLCTNGGFETNTAGWSASGTNTLARSTEQAKFGAASAKCTYQNNNDIARFAVTLTAANHALSAWLYIPSDYDGTVITVRFVNFTGATGSGTVNADMTKVDQWQEVTVGPTLIDAGDLAGHFQIVVTGGAPSAGKFIYLDGVGIELGNIASPYKETDGATATRSAARVQVPFS